MLAGIIQSVIENKQLEINKEEANLNRQKPSKSGAILVKSGPKGPRAFRRAIKEVSMLQRRELAKRFCPKRSRRAVK
jgi:hypothetical protein